MRRKIANRIRKELRSLGCIIETDRVVNDPAWYNPNTYFVILQFRDHKLACSGDNELQALKLALKIIKLEIEHQICTINNLWYI